jgi:hypothetical protein
MINAERARAVDERIEVVLNVRDGRRSHQKCVLCAVDRGRPRRAIAEVESGRDDGVAKECGDAIRAIVRGNDPRASSKQHSNDLLADISSRTSDEDPRRSERFVARRQVGQKLLRVMRADQRSREQGRVDSARDDVDALSSGA